MSCRRLSHESSSPSSATAEPGEGAARDDAPRVWLVRHGHAVVGPVTMDQVERGLAARRIPPESLVAHVARRRWMPVGDLFRDRPRSVSGIRALAQDVTMPTVPPPPPVPALPSLEDLRDTIPSETLEDPESFIETAPRARAVPAPEPHRAPTVPATPMARDRLPEGTVGPLGGGAVPAGPPSFPDEPVEIPKQGFWASLFG